MHIDEELLFLLNVIVLRHDCYSLLNCLVLLDMKLDAFACMFAKAVTEEDEDHHQRKRQSLWQGVHTEEDRVIDSVSDDRSSKYPEFGHARCRRIETHKRIVVTHEDTEEHMTRN